MSSALWWVVNGRASAPPGSGWKVGVSTSMKPRSSRNRRVSVMMRLRAWNTARLDSLAHRSA